LIFYKAFNLKELTKGFFPHGFSKLSNQNYIGKMPPIEDYGCNFFSAKKREEFLNWYKTQENTIFDFKLSLHQYCASDVAILTESCLIYSKMNRECSSCDITDPGECPFREAITLSSYCNYIYRRNFMPENSISMLPSCGYSPKSQLSIKCELWLKYVSEKQNITILHAKSGGEKKILNYYVDGFSELTKTIYGIIFLL
jgi:hypothetical protein